MTDPHPSAVALQTATGQPPRFVVLDSNVLIRLLILDFGVQERVNLSYFLAKAGASMILAHCQEDEFWRNAPEVWAKHVEKWQRIPGDIKQAISQLVDGFVAAQKLEMLTPEQLNAAAEIRTLKTIIEKVNAPDYAWSAFESFAQKELAEIRAGMPPGLVDIADVEVAAARRIQVGNPPRADGKSRHWGDCVIWETTLRLAARKEGSVWLATTDGDYSAVDKQTLHPLLEREVRAAGGNVRLFREANSLGLELRTQFLLLKEVAQFVPEREATSMRRFLEGVSRVSPEASWRDVLRAFKALPYRQREILKLRLGLGDGYRYFQREVADIFNLSQPRISQIEAEAIHRFLKMLQSDNDDPEALDGLESDPVAAEPTPSN